MALTARCTTLTRTWCVFEIYVASVTDARFEVAMATTQKQAFLQDIQANDEAFNDMLCTSKSESSQTAVPSDRDNIFKLMKQANVTFADLDRMLFDVLNKWMVRTMQSQVDGSIDLAEKAQWHFVLGSVFHHKKELDQAQANYNAALDLYRHQLHDQHADTWGVVCRAAILAFLVNEPRHVWEPMFLEALVHQSNLLGRFHIKTLTTSFSLGCTYVRSGAMEDGLPLLQTCYDTSNREYGDSEGLTLLAMSEIGQCMIYQNRLAEAEASLVECYERRCLVLGNDHLNTQLTASSLATVYFKQGKYTLAAPIIQANYDVRCRTLGPEQEDTCIARLNVGMVKLLQGRYDEAKSIFDACLATAIRLHRPTDQRLFCEGKLGHLYICVGDVDRALPYLMQAFEGFKEIYSALHMFTQTALYWY
ncbi:Aste57867_4127 [Aphanomyces stellatus]|uniref:Aste57867_4127 protein n=1 Tax=Aphanomyces stellatus TaxID=120398 RepID=A0A485KGA9_9STRA|nr:hypothetical protein As57867_004116 [Aphanomyces stellatus]VFT81257.1 Aste57867_4127 [Aphanomyces stellatus]